jgi:hypothetical protein
MRMGVFMNIDYNMFALLPYEEQFNVTQGAMQKCNLFNKVNQPIKSDILKVLNLLPCIIIQVLVLSYYNIDICLFY